MIHTHIYFITIEISHACYSHKSTTMSVCKISQNTETLHKHYDNHTTFKMFADVAAIWNRRFTLPLSFYRHMQIHAHAFCVRLCGQVQRCNITFKDVHIMPSAHSCNKSVLANIFVAGVAASSMGAADTQLSRKYHTPTAHNSMARVGGPVLGVEAALSCAIVQNVQLSQIEYGYAKIIVYGLLLER